MTHRPLLAINTVALVLAAATGLVLYAPAADGAPTRNETLRAEARLELGRRLFFDPALSRTGTVSCADCHDPDHGFSDERQFSRDENRTSPRHSQSLTDLPERAFHWDGEFDTLEEVVTARVGSFHEAATQEFERKVRRLDDLTGLQRPGDLELLGSAVQSGLRPTGSYGQTGPGSTPGVSFRAQRGRRSPTIVLIPQGLSPAERLDRDGVYARGFTRAFGNNQVTTERIATSVATYIRSLRTSENAYDRHAAGDRQALSPAAARGLELFRGKASCAQCHSLEPADGRAPFTDGRFHNTGVAFHSVQHAAETSTAEHDAIDFRSSSPSKSLRGHDLGALVHSFATEDAASFKTPSLRDVARRAPYMHDGSFATLTDVVRYYDQGGTPNAYQDRRILPLGLSEDQVTDLVAFLESLSGDERPGLGSLPDHRPVRHVVKLVDVHGAPLREVVVTLHPCGDRLAGTDALPEPFQLRTDQVGRLVFPFPASTHVQITVEGFEVGTGHPLPDYLDSHEMVATPRSTVSVEIVRGTAGDVLPDRLNLIRGNSSAQSGAGVVLRRTQTLGTNSALYAAEFPMGMAAGPWTAVDPRGRHVGTLSLDLAGGRSMPVRVHPRPIADSVTDRFVEAAEAVVEAAETALGGKRSGSGR